MKRKIDKKLMIRLACTLSIASVIGAVCAVTTNNVEVNASSSVAMDGGASVRMDISKDGDNVVIGSKTGIRFPATVPASLVSALDGEDYVGMLIVPEKVFTAFEAQSMETDYIKFIASKMEKTAAEVEADNACTFALSQLSETEDNVIYGTIASLSDANYNEAYQAVAYYVDDGVYYYAATPSEARTVAYVADEALLDADGGYSDDQKTALGNILEKSIMLENNITDEYVLSVNTLETAELAPLFSGLNATDVTFTPEDKTVATVDEDGVLTALQTAGNTLVNVSAYGGKVNFDISVKTTAVKGDAVKMHGTTFYTAYGAKVGGMNVATQTTLNALENITLGVGKVPSGSSITNITETDLPYIAFKRPNTTGSYAIVEDTGKDYKAFCVTIEFTGNNMPMVGFYVNGENPKNIVGQKGILVTNGFRVNAADKTNVFRDRFSVYGFQQLTTNPQSNDNTDATVGELDRRLYVDTYSKTDYKSEAYADTTEKALNISYNELAENPNQRYRYFVRVTANSDVSKVIIGVRLCKINEDDTNGDIVYSAEFESSNVPQAGIDFYKDNIVVYGRPYETTKIDKIYQFQNYKISDFAKKFA